MTLTSWWNSWSEFIRSQTPCPSSPRGAGWPVARRLPGRRLRHRDRGGSARMIRRRIAPLTVILDQRSEFIQTVLRGKSDGLPGKKPRPMTHRHAAVEDGSRVDPQPFASRHAIEFRMVHDCGHQEMTTSDDPPVLGEDVLEWAKIEPSALFLEGVINTRFIRQVEKSLANRVPQGCIAHSWIGNARSGGDFREVSVARVGYWACGAQSPTGKRRNEPDEKSPPRP